MRIVLVNRFYWPDESATAMLATDLAEHLAASGHQVEVLCSRSWYRRSQALLPQRESRLGVDIRRLWTPPSWGRGTAARLAASAAFHVGVRCHGFFGGRLDAILMLSDPPLLVSAGGFLRAVRGGRLVHLVFDLYPDLAIALGALPEGSPAVRWLQSRSDSWLRGCDKLLVLSELMADRLAAKGVPRERMVVTPPWADPRLLRAVPRHENDLRRSLGLREEDFLVGYSGNMGLVHPVGTFLAGLRVLDGDPRLHWLFAGGGAHLEALEAEVRRSGLSRVRFLPPQPRHRLSELLSAADLHLVSQDARSVGMCVPSKLAAVLAVERPLLFVGPEEAEVARAVRQFHCGEVISEGDVEGFTAAVRRLAADPQLRLKMGRAGGRRFRTEFAGDVVMERIRGTIEAACGAAPERP